MKIRTKLTLWFSVLLAVVTLVTVFTLIFAEKALLRQTVKSQLVQTVEDNSGELEFFATYEQLKQGFDSDRFIPLNDGFVGIDSDFLTHIRGIYVAVYGENGDLLYGENPFGRSTDSLAFSPAIRTAGEKESTCFVFDRKVVLTDTEDLWLRGTVLTDSRKGELNSLIRLAIILLPSLIVIALLGGYFIARNHLKPAERMAKAVSEISGGQDLKRRVEVNGRGDEVQELAQSFNRMLDRLEQSFEKEQQFTSDVSHELRTPVAVIAAQCDYILEEERTKDEYVEALTTVRRQSSDMSRLIADMLDYVRLEQGGQVVDKEELCLTSLVRDLCNDLSLLKERGIVLSADLTDNVLFCGNRRLLTRLFANLINNAYRYGKDNGHIAVTLMQTETAVIFSVTDDGIGIEEHHLPKLFDRFYRADSSRSSKGTGLGLPIAREIARLHGGDLTVSSRVNEGSTFTVSLPKNPA